MNMQENAEQISGAIFLIGLGLLFVTGWWFPGILFVIGASSMAYAVSNREPLFSANGALWMIGLGFVFWLNLPWGFVLLLIGASMLFSCNPNMHTGKAKHDKKYKNDDTDYI